MADPFNDPRRPAPTLVAATDLVPDGDAYQMGRVLLVPRASFEAFAVLARDLGIEVLDGSESAEARQQALRRHGCVPLLDVPGAPACPPLFAPFVPARFEVEPAPTVDFFRTLPRWW